MSIRIPYSWVFAVAFLASATAVPAQADVAWKPHLEGHDGEMKDLGDPKALKDKDWLAIRYGDYSGYRTRLAVVASEESTAVASKYKNELVKMIIALSDKPKEVASPQNHVEDLVRQALSGTNRFEMLERTGATKDIAAEQALSDSGRIDSITAAPAGRITGAEYVVKATLIELNPEKDMNEIRAAGGNVGDKGIPIFGDLGVKRRVAFCRLNVRVIRTETGEIVTDQTVDGTCTSTGLTGLTGGGIRMVGGLVRGKSKKEPPISEAMLTCARKAAYHVATTLEETVWMGTVASVTGNQITIAGGTNVGLREGMTLTLLSKSAEVVDPETNEVIGSETVEIGQVRIVSTQELFSTAEIVQGGDGAKKGDLVRVRSDNPKH